jgi:hypothetical protein
VNTDQLQTYLTALASSLTVGVVIPITILVGIVFAIYLLIARAQQDPEFNIQNVLKDENGKESFERILGFGCFAASTWVLAVVVFALPNVLTEAYITYLAAWGGTSTVKEIARRKWPTKDQP